MANVVVGTWDCGGAYAAYGPLVLWAQDDHDFDPMGHKALAFAIPSRLADRRSSAHTRASNRFPAAARTMINPPW